MLEKNPWLKSLQLCKKTDLLQCIRGHYGCFGNVNFNVDISGYEKTFIGRK